MKLNVKIDDKKETVTVFLKVDQTMDKNPLTDRQSYETKDILNLLKDEWEILDNNDHMYDIDTCLQSSTVTNFQGATRAEGTWVFKLKKETTKHSKKTITKNLDKKLKKNAFKLP